MKPGARQLRYASSRSVSLPHNVKHDFARRYALSIYRPRAVYTFIPKNACSTMRLSVAIANGAVRSAADINWIHQNNPTFSADLAALATADYTFAILRCPFARLASCYLDKIVGRYPPFWRLHDLVGREPEPEAFTFRLFVEHLADDLVLHGDEHWRPQSDFLVYAEYDELFDVADMARAATVLQERIGFDMVDARPATNHGLDGLRIVDDGGPDTAPVDLLVMRSLGKAPAPRNLYDDALVETVGGMFAADLDLYRERFGAARLMFDI